MSILPNKFDVQSAFHEQVCLAAVNQIHVFHEALNGCKNLKIHYSIRLFNSYENILVDLENASPGLNPLLLNNSECQRDNCFCIS